MNKWLAGAVVSGAALLGGFAYGAVWLRSSCLETSAICPGVRVGGEVIAEGVGAETFVAERARALAARPVDLSIQGMRVDGRTVTLGELGASVDLAGTAALVSAIGHVGTYADRFDQARRAARGMIDVPLLVNVDAEQALRTLAPIKDATDELPIPARLDLAHGGVVPEVPGHFLDIEGALDKIRTAALSSQSIIELPRLSIEPRISREFLEHVESARILARFQTWFSRFGDQVNRAQNIETAAARLDGVVLLPGELFSFNGLVGPRTVENGFSRGWEIFKGEMVEGVGGGTCQAASTFHAAAFLAGLDIIERLPHSRPSAYITMGLDATVVYPIVDLKLRNPYDFPVVVHAYVQGNSVVFEIRGRESPARVTFRRDVLATRAYTRKVEEKPGIPRGKVVRKQHGIQGYKIKRTRTIAYRDGTARRESNIDIYWPTFELYLVAPGVDPEPLLPPPSEGQDESGASGWSILPDSDDASPADDPGPSATAAPAAPAVTDAALAACGSDCPPARPKVVEAPGVHAPRAEQLRAPLRVIIGGGASRP